MEDIQLQAEKFSFNLAKNKNDIDVFEQLSDNCVLGQLIR